MITYTIMFQYTTSWHIRAKNIHAYTYISKRNDSWLMRWRSESDIEEANLIGLSAVTP